MAISIPRKIVEFALLGPTNDRRQLQDSPILGDVWLTFGEGPDKAIELLIEPHWQESAGTVAAALNDAIDREGEEGPDLAPLHGVVAARLFFDEVLYSVVPRTTWWNRSVTLRQYGFLRGDVSSPGAAATRREQKGDPLARVLAAAMTVLHRWVGDDVSQADVSADDGTLPALDRFLALATLILWAREQKVGGETAASHAHENAVRQIVRDVARTDMEKRIAALLGTLPAPLPPTKESPEPEGADSTPPAKTRTDIIWQVSLNRRATPALVASVPAVKGDAARRLFDVSCKQIAWAVIDSGIQGDHKAFLDADGRSRVKRSFDFTNIREIVSLDNLKENRRQKRLAKLLDESLPLRERPDHDRAVQLLTRLADDSRNRRPIHWELVRPFVEIDPKARPKASDHGTHVAGVIGANAKKGREGEDDDAGSFGDGMCPDIQLWDFRVLAPALKETEFAIIAALQFIRYVNSQTDYMSVHGANLSLSIQHDVRNYACGRTPICLECERLVDSGVMVVAAAGNLGYQSFQTTEGSYDGYAAFSVTDPGNAEGVLTVGSTHRSAPHTYGVSFFSSRGPTGDGRAKPDLVAPGERIRAPFRESWGDLDGTSMAAPHVSGAAAMLMARYAELIGQPRRVKKILCDSATDLGRERSFQGFGMLDVLRAFQSI